MYSANEYVYKQEVNWSLLTEGMTLPVENQVIFGRIMNRFLEKGERKDITLYLDGKPYSAKIVNVNYSPKYIRKHDVLQIRYPKNGELARELQKRFVASYLYLENEYRRIKEEGLRKRAIVPDVDKEYLAIYTTEYDDSYILETIEKADILELREKMQGKEERAIELDYNFELQDHTSTLIETNRTMKIRKLNRKIGDNLKMLYGYRCQICGKMIGEEYGAHIVEAHHIDYFVHSLNNDASNQLIVCPNHHSIIHDVNPTFEREDKMFVYENGYQEKLMLNKHL